MTPCDASDPILPAITGWESDESQQLAQSTTMRGDALGEELTR